ncbi:MAG: hypothetical protein QOE16_536, partial [Microbacteriaceae bacterium]|nr:hypothetical protein [Microbacteriaceae bacterium]
YQIDGSQWETATSNLKRILANGGTGLLDIKLVDGSVTTVLVNQGTQLIYNHQG